MLVAKEKKVHAKEKSLRQKEINYGKKKKIATKRKIVAAKESNSLKKTKILRRKVTQEKHH